jgi:IS5 family transposase
VRQSYSTQLRLDSQRIDEVPLNLNCRDSMIKVLKALQYVYSKPAVIDEIMSLIRSDVNSSTSSNNGREGMDYWHILVLASVRLGCNLTYDRLHDLSENHRTLRAIMGIGAWDEQTEFKWKTIRNNICLVRPKTIEQINQLIVAAGHELVPEAIEKVRADSFVMETNIHYPTESSLIRDGLKKIISMCVQWAQECDIPGWRQHDHLWKTIRKLVRKIERIAQKKGPNYIKRMQVPYRELLDNSQRIITRARSLCSDVELGEPSADDILEPHSLPAFIARTERVMDTATRRVLNGETVPNSDKLFSVFEPHTQLYKRGKAGQPMQFGRQVLVFEDGAGFIVQGTLMKRDECDSGVAVEQTRILQQRFNDGVNRLSFDRGFHSPDNQTTLSELVENVCLPKPGAKQSVKQLEAADEEFLAAKQNHSGVESAIGALQSGNAMQRCRDRSEIGFERYLQLGILGRNLHTLGRLLIAEENENTAAGQSRRKAA